MVGAVAPSATPGYATDINCIINNVYWLVKQETLYLIYNMLVDSTIKINITNHIMIVDFTIETVWFTMYIGWFNKTFWNKITIIKLIIKSYVGSILTRLLSI